MEQKLPLRQNEMIPIGLRDLESNLTVDIANTLNENLRTQAQELLQRVRTASQDASQTEAWKQTYYGLVEEYKALKPLIDSTQA